MNAGASRLSRAKDAVARLCADYCAEEPGGKSWLDENLAACRAAGLLLLLGGYACAVVYWYNNDMREMNNIAEKKSQVGKEFQRREDLVGNLAGVVNDYARHERVLFQHVSDLRAQLQSLEAMDGAPSAAQNSKLEQAFLRLTALAEQYPDLKAEKRFHDLMDAAETTEDRIAARLDEYIEAVLDFNICNQCYWCNYFTYLPSLFIPLPAYWEYYNSASSRAPRLTTASE